MIAALARGEKKAAWKSCGQTIARSVIGEKSQRLQE